MHRRLEAVGSRLLGLFVPAVQAGACGPQTIKHYTSCWQCDSMCGYSAPCYAYCRSGCGCSVDPNYCQC